MNSKMLLCTLSVTALLALGLVPTEVGAQEYECSDCNVLTDKCSDEGTGTEAFCYEDTDPEGEQYCNTYGGIGDCDPIMTSIGADGIPQLRGGFPDAISPVYADGVATETDCRERVRAIFFLPEVAVALRAEVARIVI
jgi:hypothetical protein